MSGLGLAAGNNSPAEVWELPLWSSRCPNPITTSWRAGGQGWDGDGRSTQTSVLEAGARGIGRRAGSGCRRRRHSASQGVNTVKKSMSWDKKGPWEG